MSTTKSSKRRTSSPRLFNSGAEARARNAAGEELAAARCPVCRHPLIARLGKRGPYFHCACRRRKAA